MVAVWLYSADGRALYFVAVQLPMPLTVTYAGQFFYWNRATSRYELCYPKAVKELGNEAVPNAGPEHYPV